MAKENKCKTRIVCESRKHQHPTCPHKERQTDAPDEANKTSEPASTKYTVLCGVEGQESGQVQSLIIPVWVSRCNIPEKEELTYALIDCQSNATFVTENLRQAFGIEGVKSNLLLSTMHEKMNLLNVASLSA